MTDLGTAPDERVELLDALPDGVLLADGDGVVTHANDMARRLLRTDDLVGRPLAEAVALQDLDGQDWFTVTAPYSGPGIRTMQVEQAWRLGDGTELLVSTRMIRPGPHKPVERVAVSLRSARARSRLDRERSDLVATVAHELRSPLTGVKGFTGTLLARWDKFNDEQKRLIMQSVHADTDRLTRLIAELLEVARIDTGRLSLHPKPLDVVPAVDHVLSSIHAGTGREILFQHPDDLPQILADPDRFAQVLTNVVDNAVRHGEGQVCVTATVEADGDVNGDTNDGGAATGVLLAVEDEGDGISPAIRNRVFTKFWKHGSREGSGLGMYIAHGLVTAHGGRITIGDADHGNGVGGARIEMLWPVFAL